MESGIIVELKPIGVGSLLHCHLKPLAGSGVDSTLH